MPATRKSAVVRVKFHATQRARSAVAAIGAGIATERFRSIVRGEHHERVVAQLEFLEHIEYSTHGAVDVLDIGKELGLIDIACPRQVLGHQIGRRRYRFMRFMKRTVDEERLLRLRSTVLLQPADDFVSDQLAAETGQRTDRLAVAHEVDRVLVRGGRVVLCRQPMVKALIARLRLSRRVELCVAVPLAGHARGVA